MLIYVVCFVLSLLLVSVILAGWDVLDLDNVEMYVASSIL